MPSLGFEPGTCCVEDDDDYCSTTGSAIQMFFGFIYASTNYYGKSDANSAMPNNEFRTVIKFPTNSDSSPSILTVKHWSKVFRSRRESFKDNLCKGGSVTMTTPENVALVEQVVLSDSRLKSKK